MGEAQGKAVVDGASGEEKSLVHTQHGAHAYDVCSSITRLIKAVGYAHAPSPAYLTPPSILAQALLSQTLPMPSPSPLSGLSAREDFIHRMRERGRVRARENLFRAPDVIGEMISSGRSEGRSRRVLVG
jgi:hypothetical protein